MHGCFENTKARHSESPLTYESPRDYKTMSTGESCKSKPSMQKNRIELVEIFERWARYRITPKNNGWPRQVTLGKLLDGIPGTDCPRCKDALTGASVGFIHIAAEGLAKQKVPCPVCKGDRKVKFDHCPNKANPMLISGTGSRIGFDDDTQSQKLDWIICVKMSEPQRVVILAEFTENGTKNDKISRLRMTHSLYADYLDSAFETALEYL